MKKLWLAALSVEAATLLVRGYSKAAAQMPDWTLRLNGVIMLAGAAFASVRLT